MMSDGDEATMTEQWRNSDSDGKRSSSENNNGDGNSNDTTMTTGSWQRQQQNNDAMVIVAATAMKQQGNMTTTTKETAETVEQWQCKGDGDGNSRNDATTMTATTVQQE